MTADRIEEIAREIYECLGTGHTEAIYQGAFEIALRDEHVRFERQKDVPVMFRGMQAGRGIADIVLPDIIIELKATVKIQPGDMAQVRNYMRSLGITRGVVVNFCQPSSKGDAKLQIEYVSE
jgi:GxxExxY protein